MSTPLSWDDAATIDPDELTISTVPERVARLGDPWAAMAENPQSLEPLLEMARWRYIGHAEAALTVLGRIAGIEEDSLSKMIEAGQTATILAKFDR